MDIILVDSCARLLQAAYGHMSYTHGVCACSSELDLVIVCGHLGPVQACPDMYVPCVLAWVPLALSCALLRTMGMHVS